MENNIPKVMIVGSAEKSKGGVSSAIKNIRQMHCWNNYNCYWLGTQIQGSYLLKLWYCITAYIIAFFKIWKYDIIHFHTVPDRICLIIQLPIFLLSLATKKKTILHIHMGNQLIEHKNNRLFLWYLNHTNLIVLLAKKWEMNFKEWYPNIITPCTTIYNACNHVDSIDYKKRNNTILFAAHLNKNKGYEILLNAYKCIYNKIPDWKLIILGDGEIDKAQNLSRKLGINKNIEFTGYIDGIQKQEYFQKASIFCLCSYQEGFPMVILEAWSYGIPVITTPVGGLPDVLIENKNACTFNFGDYEELSNKLLYLINNYQQREFMSKFSKEFVDKTFSLNNINKKYSEIWNKLYQAN